MKGIIRVGDPTSHGGKVLAGCDRYKVLGIAVARVGDTCSCPVQGHTNCKIVEGHSHIKIDGVSVAFDGCKTTCGAKLITTTDHTKADR